MKIIFFGTSRIAAGFLEFLAQHHQVVLVITTAPKPAGRGGEMKMPAVASSQRGEEVVFVDKFDEALVSKIAGFNPDLGVVVDFGKIIPEKVFNLPKYKTINVHFSLLPRWRGAAPIQWALLSGDKETGVSIFYLEKALDTGPLLATEKITIVAADNAWTLEDKLGELGKKMLLKTIEDISAGKAKISPQIGIATFAPQIRKEQGLVDWNKPAVQIHNQVRALCKWPKACTFYPTKNGPKMLKILHSEIITVCPGNDQCCPLNPPPGVVTGRVKGGGFIVKCGENFLLVKKVLPQDKKVMSAWDFWQGAHLDLGVKLGDFPPPGK